MFVYFAFYFVEDCLMDLVCEVMNIIHTLRCLYKQLDPLKCACIVEDKLWNCIQKSMDGVLMIC
jgi:hypothetical protein